MIFLLVIKNEIRKRILAARGRMSEDELSSKSDIIRHKIIESDKFADAGLVLCYMDFRNEVKTGGIIMECLSASKRIALPLIKHNGTVRELLAYEIKDLDNDVQEGTCGILEPCPEKLQMVDNTEIDLVIVPGVAFDIHKHRMGYGAGYYDRFLKKLQPVCVKMGIAFEIQIEDRIPVEAHDISMDIIITESRII